MPSFEFPLRAPTSVLFFLAAGIVTYYSRDYAEIEWMAVSAFAFFLSLGPVQWIERTIYSLRKVYRVSGNDSDDIADTDMWDNPVFEWTGRIAAWFQIGLLLFGTGVGVVKLWPYF